MSNRRPLLVEAASWALKWSRYYHRPVGIVAADLSRFIRPRAFNRQRNPNAWPTADEFAELHSLTYDLPLATLVDPLASERERSTASIARGGNAGRRPAISEAKKAAIFSELEFAYLVVLARNNATNSFAAVRLKLARSVDGGRACVAATLAL